jgi:hypothetical protein
MKAIRGKIAGEGCTVAMTLTAPPAADSVPEPLFSRGEVIVQAGVLLASVVDGVRFDQLDDTEVVAVMAALEGVGRKVDGASVRR